MESSGGHQSLSPKTDLPLVLLHRMPNFTVPLPPSVHIRFRILDPHEVSNSDPDILKLFGSVRLLLCFGLAPVTSETLDRYPSLQCVVGSTAGVDHVDLAECRHRGIRVTSSGEAFSDDAADYAVGLLIDVLRRVSAADRFVRAGSWPVKGEFQLGYKVGGKRVGIVGLGNIGLRTSKRLVAFGCSIAYNSRKPKPDVPFPYYASVSELASWSDILILCCSSTKETYHIVDKNVMSSLGNQGIIINVGRGALIDEKELVQFLLRGEIGGAGLDVYENEPNVPEELFGLENVVLSPHRAILTPESIEAGHKIFVDNLEACFSNKPLLCEVGYN